MTIEKEAIDAIAKLGTDAAMIEVIDTGDVRCKLLAAAGSVIREVVIPPPPRSHKPADLEALTDFVQYIHNKQTKGERDVGPIVVWHGHPAVEVVIDDADRHDRVLLLLQRSSQFERIALMERANQDLVMKAHILVRLLRLEFGVESPTLALFRSLRWSSSGLTTQTADARRESLGQQIQREVAGIDSEIPDKITVMVPVYETPGEMALYPVELLIEPILESEAFLVKPPPGTISELIARHQASIHDRLVAAVPDGVQVFAGSP